MQLLPNTEEIVGSLEIICREEKRIRQTAADLNSLDSGYIRIGSIQSISYHWLPDILRKFSESYPKITFELYVEGFRPLISNLKTNKLTASSYPGIRFPITRSFPWEKTS